MAQGIFVNGERPKSKRQIVETVKSGKLRHVHLEATSVMGNEPDGLLDEIPNGRYYFVGPDPYKNRKFYGQIIKSDAGVVVR